MISKYRLQIRISHHIYSVNRYLTRFLKKWQQCVLECRASITNLNMGLHWQQLLINLKFDNVHKYEYIYLYTYYNNYIFFLFRCSLNFDIFESWCRIINLTKKIKHFENIHFMYHISTFWEEKVKPSNSPLTTYMIQV